MRTLARISITAGFVALISFVGFRVVLVYQQDSRLDQRIQDIQSVGQVYSYLDFETKGRVSKEDLTPHMPAGFPLDQYDFLPSPTNFTGLTAANDLVLVREAVVGQDGRRLKFFADGSVLIDRE